MHCLPSGHSVSWGAAAGAQGQTLPHQGDFTPLIPNSPGSQVRIPLALCLPWENGARAQLPREGEGEGFSSKR